MLEREISRRYKSCISFSLTCEMIRLSKNAEDMPHQLMVFSVMSVHLKYKENRKTIFQYYCNRFRNRFNPHLESGSKFMSLDAIHSCGNFKKRKQSQCAFM